MTNEYRTRVLIADDHFLIRDGLRGLLSADPAFLCVGEVQNGAELTSAVAATAPDLLILDLSMPQFPDPASFVRHIRREHPTLKVLVLTAHDDRERIYDLLTAGVSGYVLKDEMKETFLQAVRQISQGEKYYSQRAASLFVQQVAEAESEPESQALLKEELTAREIEVLELVGLGLTNPQIAAKLDISVRTVRNHINHIFGKLSVSTREEAVQQARRRFRKKIMS